MLKIVGLSALAASGLLLAVGPANAKGCNGYVNVAEWGCAPWDNNNGPKYPHYRAPTKPPQAHVAPTHVQPHYQAPPSVVGHGGNNGLISPGNRNGVVSNSSSTLISPGNRNGVVSQGGGNAIGNHGSGVVSQGGGNLISPGNRNGLISSDSAGMRH